MGTALLVLGGIEAVTATGFETALQQRQGDVEPFYDSAFTIQVFRGLVLGLLVWLVAPVAADIVAAPIVAPVIRAASVILVLRGFYNPARVRLFREFRYDVYFWWSLPEVAVTLGLSIALGIALRSVWALVISALAGQAVSTAMSYAMVRRRPRLSLNRVRIRELAHFGKWVFASQLMTFLSLQGDNAFVAKVLGIGPLGLYQVAFRIAELPVTGFTQVVTQVALPALSAIQTERQRLRSWYVTAQGIVVAVHGTFVGLFLLFGGPLVHVLLGDRWLTIVPVLKVLVIAMFFRSMVDVSSTLFNALGEPRYSYYLHATRVAIMATALYPLSRIVHGITGVAIAVLLSLLGAMILCVHRLHTMLGGGWIGEMRLLIAKRS